MSDLSALASSSPCSLGNSAEPPSPQALPPGMMKEQDNYNSNNEIRGPQLLLNVELLPEGLRGVPGENSDAGGWPSEGPGAAASGSREHGQFVQQVAAGPA